MNRSPRLGAIYPDDEWMEVEALEFKCFMPEGVELVSAATPIPAGDATLDTAIVLAENGDIEEAARRLLRYEPTCFAYYCATVSFARGPGMDLDISRRITEATGKAATTTSTAIIRAFKALNISRVALASPYLPNVEQKFIEFIGAHGIKVLRSASSSLKEGHSVASPDEMFELAKLVDVPDAEAVFVGCTGQRLAEYIEAMEAKLGKPVLTANQVTSWDVLQLMGITAKLKRRGHLFSGDCPKLR